MIRGQAALEFLTTYGWAFMVILVAIGALSYLGVTNPDRFIPERCISSQGISCTDHQVTSEQARIFVSNDLGVMIHLEGTSFNLTSTSTGEIVSEGCIAADGLSIPPNGRKEITCDVSSSSLTSGTRERLEFSGEYRREGGRYNQPFKIELVATIQEGTTSTPPGNGGPVTCNGYTVGFRLCQDGALFECQSSGSLVRIGCSSDQTCQEGPAEGNAHCDGLIGSNPCGELEIACIGGVTPVCDEATGVWGCPDDDSVPPPSDM